MRSLSDHVKVLGGVWGMTELKLQRIFVSSFLMHLKKNQLLYISWNFCFQQCSSVERRVCRAVASDKNSMVEDQQKSGSKLETLDK